MDIWVVAAAAGAGYVAQHWKNFVNGRRSFSDSSCESPIFRPEFSRSAQQGKGENSWPCDVLCSKRLAELVSEKERLSQDSSMAEMDSRSGDCADSYTYSASNLVPRSSSYEDVQVPRGAVGMCGDKDESYQDLSLLPSTRETGVSYGFARKKNSLRSRRTNARSLKPLNSLESCLMAQLYKERSEMGEYSFTPVSSPCTPTVEPFVVTDGSRIISRATGNSCNLPIGSVQDKPHTATNSEDILGVPRLPSLGSVKLRKKAKSHIQMEQHKRLSHSCGVKGKHHRLQSGTSQGALLFCLGLSLGLISSFLTNKREVDKLSDLLKQTESLVQDLQDELEMKDSFTVKELAIEDSESQDTQNDAFNNGPLHTFSPEEKLNDFGIVYKDQKAEEESLRKIEAELEAELEMLELNMSSSRLDRKISSLVELDADYVPDLVEGELSPRAFTRPSGPQPYAEQNKSSNSTPHSVHYAVSPRELTLRLHEVIQSRLEQRVQELEIALQNSQREVRSMESEQTTCRRQFSKSESACCSTEGGPDFKEPNQTDQPVVINLSGEALDVDNEPYNEFAKINELEEADSPPGVNYSHKQELLQTGDQKEYWLHDSNGNYEVQGNSFSDKTPLRFSTLQGGEDDYYLSNGIISTADEGEIGYDGMEEILIKHIVEQARKGSPAVLNAQRAFFSPVENEYSQEVDVDNREKERDILRHLAF